MSKAVLDVCCGSRMMWFNRTDSRAIFMDEREGVWSRDLGTPATKGRNPIVVAPDILGSFADIPFPANSFALVVMDPPHHTSSRLSDNTSSIIKNSYGVLIPGWEEVLKKGFEECFRVLKPSGVLIFKWGSKEIPLDRVLGLTPCKPLFGHTTNKKGTTHWVAFMKEEA